MINVVLICKFFENIVEVKIIIVIFEVMVI